MKLQLPTLILIIAGLISLGWLLIYRRVLKADTEPASEAKEEEPEPEPASEPLPKLTWQNFRSRILIWIRENWRFLAYALLVTVLILIIWQLSPRAFTRYATHAHQPGHPLYALTYVRSFYLNLAPDLAWILATLIGMASLALVIVAQIRRQPQPAQFVLLMVSIGLFSLGQLTLLSYYRDSLLVLYLVAVFFLSIWILGYQSNMRSDLLTKRWPLRFEILMLLIPLAITIWARFSVLNELPYGIEGDESKWTVEVVASMIDGDFPHSTAYHLSSVPASFYMQAPFHRLLGPSLLSARIAVAFYSVLGSLAFYWLARELTNPRVAWLANMLLAASIFDVSASRLANVESFVKLWPVLCLALLAYASRTGKKSAYLFSGITAAVGILTYDTVAPLIPLAYFLAIFELIRNRVKIAESIKRLTAFSIPVIAGLPITAAYLFGRLQYYDMGSKGWDSDVFSSFVSHIADLLHSIFIATWSDFLYNRDGPLFNSLLIPWLLAGVLLLAFCWRRGKTVWILAFGAIFFFPVPILTNSPMGRVLYPGIPAAYLIIAAAIMAALHAIIRITGPVLRPAVISLAALALGFVCAINLYIYFNEVQDPEDRRIRRALYDVVREVSSPEVITLMPYVPKGDDPIQQEGEQMIWFALRTKAASPDDLAPLQVLPLSDLLPAISDQPPEIVRGELIWDRRSTFARDERDDMLATFQMCYPDTVMTAGPYFDRYTIPAESLRSPNCRSGILTLEPRITEIPADTSVQMTWSLAGTTAADITLECNTVREFLTWIHAEDFIGQGWESIDYYVTGYDGRGFLTDHQGSQTATLNVGLPAEGPLYIWIRTLRRVIDDYPGYLEVGNESFEFSHAGFVPLNEWTWERVGPLEPDSDHVELSILRPYPSDRAGYMALFIDTLLITASSSFDPNSEPIWELALQMDIPLRGRASEGSFLLNADPGHYLCQLEAMDDESLVDHRGNVGLRSNTADVLILPPP